MRTNESEILLVGYPNVGKSVLFSRITGIKTLSSNYSGTTVSFETGYMQFNGKRYEVVDAPGLYSMKSEDSASKVAVDLISRCEMIINVIDATHLERNLLLTLELLSLKIPMVIALNLSDEARHLGIDIDPQKLSSLLGVPVISTVARTGEGIKDLISSLFFYNSQVNSELNLNARDENSKWCLIGKIVLEVQTLKHKHHSLYDFLEDMSVHPVWGNIIAFLVIFLSFICIRIIGEFLVNGSVGFFSEPWFSIPFGFELLFDKLWTPVLMKLSLFLGENSFLHKIFIGSLINGHIDYFQSFGVLSSGLFIPIGAVLPYIFSFYFVISILEDTGYLPRLAVFLDSIMHRIGLHGYAIVPTLLGLGCNVPGIMATRILENKSQRFITATLISIAVPCISLQAMIIGLVGNYGLGPVLLIYAILFAVWVVIGFILKVVSKGYEPELLLEIPRYRLPSFSSLKSKMYGRIVSFIKEAVPLVIVSILIVNLLYQFNVFNFVAAFFSPVVTYLWGMPKESIIPLFVGILRKDVAIGMFAPLNMSVKQLVTGSVVLSMFFPCVAAFAVLSRELGLKDTVKAVFVMIFSVFIVGTLINFIWNLI